MLGRCEFALCFIIVFALPAGGCTTTNSNATTAGYGYTGGSTTYVAKKRAPEFYAPSQPKSEIKHTYTVRFPQKFRPGEIVVSFADRRLYFIDAPGRAISYPIASPRDQDLWEGVTSVSAKRENPPWYPTDDMRRENPRLPSYVPGGHPRNPLGVRALYLGTSTYRIHGTDAPWTIGTPVSKGCIRMFDEHVRELYDRVDLGARVTVGFDPLGVS